MSYEMIEEKMVSCHGLVYWNLAFDKRIGDD